MYLNKSILHGLILVLLVVFCSVKAEIQDQPALTYESYQELSSARELMEEGKYTEAENKLKKLLATGPVQYDEAVIWQTLGHIYIATDNYQKAADSFIRSIKNDVLPANVTHGIFYNIAQLLVATSRYKESLDYLLPWLEGEQNPGAEAHILAASVFYEIKDYKQMISHVQKAIKLTPRPDKSLYEMQLSGYYQIEDFKQAANLLERMIELFPEDEKYWKQLAATYQLSKQFKKALAMYELALNNELLDETDTLRLVHLYLQEDLPYKAAMLLNENLDSGLLQKTAENLELLVTSWLLARENNAALKALTQLVNIKNDPAIYYRIGRILFEQEQWKEAMINLEKATKAENRETQAEAYLLIGIAAYHTNQVAKSSRALNAALFSESTREQALWWLDKLWVKREHISG